MDAVAEVGRNPASKHQIDDSVSLSVENKRADTGQDGRTRLARPKSQEQTERGETYVSCSADLEQDWQLTRLIDTLLIVLKVQIALLRAKTYQVSCAVLLQIVDSTSVYCNFV